MNKKEIYKEIFNELISLEKEEFHKKLKEQENGYITNALIELGIADYLWKEFEDKFDGKYEIQFYNNIFYSNIEFIIPNTNVFPGSFYLLFREYFLEYQKNIIYCNFAENLDNINKEDFEDMGIAA